MTAALFLAACLWLGTAATLPWPLRWHLPLRLAAGWPVGLAVGGLLGFVLACLFGLSEEVILGTTIALLMGGLVLVMVWSARLGEAWRDTRALLADRLNLYLAAVFVAMAVLLGLIMGHALFFKDGVLTVGFSNVWGDWNQHLQQVTGFVYGDNFPPGQPAMSGQRLTYPFVTNFLSAVLFKGGFSLPAAFTVPSILLAWSGLALLMAFARAVAGRAAAALTPFLFFLGGGWGFVNFFDDLWHKEGSLGGFLTSLPHNYTQTWGDVAIPNINFINPIFADLVPQRAFLFGLPLFLLAVLLLWQALREKNRALLLPAGLTAALLPLTHTHGLVTLGFFWLILFWRSWQLAGGTWRKAVVWWLPFLGPVALVGLPQFFWLTAGLTTAKFFRFQFGWTTAHDNIVWFWLKNLGLFIPLYLLVLVRFRQARPHLITFGLAAGFVFAVANLFIFQPWDWDNSKLLVYWYALAAPLAALGLVMIWRRWRTLAAAAFLSLVLAGSLDASHGLPGTNYALPVFDQGQQAIADVVRDTPPHSVFLTGQYANNPVSGLAGRRTVLGYTGWLWSYGLEYTEREAEVRDMFNGLPQTSRLLAKYKVDYVLIGPGERDDRGYRVNEDYFRRRFALFARVGDTAIYDVHLAAKSTVAAAG